MIRVQCHVQHHPCIGVTRNGVLDARKVVALNLCVAGDLSPENSSKIE